MLHRLVEFYEHYPKVMFSIFQIAPEKIGTELQHRLEDFRERQLTILREAHAFSLTPGVENMLAHLINEMKLEGLEDTYGNVRLPFPAITLEKNIAGTDDTLVGYVTQVEGELFTQSFMVNAGGMIPNMLVLRSSGLNGEYIPTPTLELVEQFQMAPNIKAGLEQEKSWSEHFLALAVGVSTLLKYESMLEVEDMPVYPRAERRRAAKRGTTLPDSRVSKIILGESGKGQLEAMNEANSPQSGEARTVRTHWVRGHFMRNRSGGLSWRMPHLRGTGPRVSQKRIITASDNSEPKNA